jgi:hypothetical protein
MSDGGKLERIIVEFEIEDRDGLLAAIGRAIGVYTERNVLDFRHADTIDELADHLGKVIELFKDPLNSNRMDQHWRMLSAAEQSVLPDYIPDFVRQLEMIQITAEAAHQERAQQRGKLSNQALLAAIEVLANYWETTLHRLFTSDHRWEIGKWFDGTKQPEPVTAAGRFAWLAINYFEPTNGDEMRRVLRTFADNRK